MRTRWIVALAILLSLALFAFGQQPPPADRDTLPNGKSRKLELIKHDHEKSLEDVAAILELARSLEAELEANTEHVVSLESMRKAEEIEELAKRLQKRMKRIY